MKAKTAEKIEEAANHLKQKIRMRILTIRNDSPELHALGGKALASGVRNAKNVLLDMQVKDGPKKTVKNKEKEKKKKGPTMDDI